MHSLNTITKLNGEYPADSPCSCGCEKFADPALTHRLNAIPKRARPYDYTGAIIAYEQGELDEPEVIELFQYLVDSGLAWELQGSYGRAAMRFIKAGIVVLNPGPVSREERDFEEARKEPLRRGRCAPSGGR